MAEKKDLITKYHIDTRLYEGDTGLLFDTRKEAEDWVQRVGRPFEITEVKGVMAMVESRTGLTTSKRVETFVQLDEEES